MLLLLRLMLVAAPVYNVYEFMTTGGGSSAEIDVNWWLANGPFIAWALGPYIILFICTFARFINSAQKLFLFVGGVGVTYFFMSRDFYLMFLDLPFFMGENKIYLPIIPYIITVFAALLAVMFKTRRRRAPSMMEKS